MSYIVQKLFHLLIFGLKHTLILLYGNAHLVHAVRNVLQLIAGVDNQRAVLLTGDLLRETLHTAQWSGDMFYQ